MAGKAIKGITIQIGADTVGLDKALKGVETAGKKTASELREVENSLKKAPDSAVLWSQKQELLNDALEKSREKLKLLEDAQAQVNAEFSKGAVNEEQYRAFQREIENTRSEVGRYENGLKDADEKVRALGDDAGDTSGDVRGLGDAAGEAAGGGISAMTVALGELAADGIKMAARELKDFTADVVKTGADFEAGMSQVAAISGATGDELELLTAKAEEMGASTKFTASESAEAFNYMAMAGWKTEEMLGGIDGILSLAAASGEDLATTSDIVTDAMTAFGLSADNAGHFADVLAAASSNANTNVSMMGETFKYVAPVAGAMSYSIEDTAEAISLMANAGIKSTQAGTALRSIITRLSTDAGASKNSLGALGTLTEELGVQFYNADGSARDFGDVLNETREAWKGLTDEQQTSYGKTIAGTNALSGWLALMNAAPEDVEKLSGAIRDCDGAATDMSTTMMDNLQGDMTVMQSAVDGMKISLSKELEPVLREGVQYITKHMPEIQSALSKVFRAGADGLSFAIRNVPKVISAVQALMPLIKTAAAAYLSYKLYDKTTKFVGLLTSMTGPQGVIVAAVGAVGLLTTAFQLLTDAQHDELTATEKMEEQYKEELDAVDGLRGSLNSMKDDFYKRAGDINAETERTKDLWKELDKLTDSTGKVRDADKKRAEYLLGELNTALGTEYTMTGNQIDRYKDMEAEVDKLIEKKKASMYLDEFMSQATEQRKVQADARTAYQEAYAKRNELMSEPEFMKADERFKEITGHSMVTFAPDDYWLSVARGHNAQFDRKYENLSDEEYDQIVQELYDISEQWKDTSAEIIMNQRLMNENQGVYEGSLGWESQLREAETAFASEDYSKVSSILYDSDYGDRYALEHESDLQKRQEKFREMVTRSLADMELAIDAGSQYAVDQALSSLGETVEAGALAVDDLRDVFSREFMDRVQDMLDKGFDISALAKWGKDSGLDVGDMFSTDFKTLVQTQIDRGFDILDLLEWGADSGLLTAGSYDDEFEKKVQEALSNFYPDTSGMVSWALENGASLGELFGTQFQSWSTRYMWATNSLQTHNISSDWDAKLYNGGQGDYKIGYVSKTDYKAAGGWISGAGIVAEAGPELIELINGGVKVTPLSRTAKNTPVGSGDGAKKLIYNNITVNAAVSSDYDVTRLAERLAAEQRRIEEGKGI